MVARRTSKRASRGKVSTAPPPGGNSIESSKAKRRPSHVSAPSAENKTVDTPKQRRNSHRAIVFEAQRRLNDMGVTLSELSELTGKSRQACSKWLRGDAAPSEKTQEEIAKRWPNVAKELWAKPNSDQLKASLAKEDQAGLKTLTARDAAAAHLLMLQRFRRDEETRQGSNLLRLVDMERKAILDFAKFNGELTAAEENRLTQTKRWASIRGAVAKALAKHPEAARALAASLEALGA